MKMKKAFTLAEVLITLAIIGVVAAISIPSVVANTQQKEFQTGLRKAVSVLNSAITMNMAIDGESPYENKALYFYFMRHMSIMKSSVFSQAYNRPSSVHSAEPINVSFYTTDGMRFEFPFAAAYVDSPHPLYENPEITLRPSVDGTFGYDHKDGHITYWGDSDSGARGSRCGSYGMNNNTDNTANPPCLVVVDVNGDRKPFPKNAACYTDTCKKDNVRKYGDPSGLHLTDSFAIMITDKQAIPYGQAAQKAMYQAQKTK